MNPEIEAIKNLLSKMPLPPSTEIPHGASAEQVAAFESRWNVRLPDSLCMWLLMTNGPCIGPGGVFGIDADRDDLDIGRHWTSSPEWLANGWIPVASDGTGGYFMLLLNAEAKQTRQDDAAVALLDTNWNPAELSYAVSSGLWPFLRFLMESELGEGAWPFQKAYVLERDPKLAEVQGIPLPWEVA